MAMLAPTIPPLSSKGKSRFGALSFVSTTFLFVFGAPCSNLLVFFGLWTSVVAVTASASTSVGTYFIYRSDPFALLTGTLRTYQKAACDGEYMALRCPTGTTISVQLAQYGKTAPSPALCQSNSNNHPDLQDISDPYNNITCQLPGAIQSVVASCQKRNSCKFQTSPLTFGGDPCPGSRKYVELAYKCEFRSVIGCEGESIQLRCNRSSRLAIYSANYGRTEYESVQCPQPKGVHEESCLSSFATEQVMQLCHGKRRCALGVNRSTFGSPCKPESSIYMKVIFTCIPRKVLKEKYQGELEPDEMFEDETEYETGDPVGGVVEQPSIYSPDHSKGWVNPKSTSRPSTPSKSHSSDEATMELPSSPIVEPSAAVLDIEGLQPISGHGNSDRLWLYITISIACCLLVILVVLLVKIWVQRSSLRRQAGCPNSKPSSSSAGPILSSTGGLSDMDELSIVMDNVTELPSILRKSSGDELQRGLSAVTSASSTLTSVSISGGGGVGSGGQAPTMTPASSLPATMTLNRSRAREAPNIRFYYD